MSFAVIVAARAQAASTVLRTLRQGPGQARGVRDRLSVTAFGRQPRDVDVGRVPGQHVEEELLDREGTQDVLRDRVAGPEEVGAQGIWAAKKSDALPWARMRSRAAVSASATLGSSRYDVLPSALGCLRR